MPASTERSVSRGRARHRALLAAGVLAALPAAAEEAAPDLTPTFRYEAAQGPHRLRAAAEIGAVLALGAATWLVAPSPTAVPGSKADGVRLDANPFRTNFGAHPVVGAIYYQLARSNRLSAAESALWAVGGSTVWEAIERNEPASLNDLFVTPVAGVALGAPLLELAAHLDRGPRTPAREALAWILAPPKKAHDAIDRARPARGDPGDVLEATAGAGAGAARLGGASRGEVRAAAAFRLVRDPGWGAPGEGARVLGDAAVSALALEVALASGGLSDLAFGSGVLLVAVHGRDLADDGGRLRGAEVLAGAGAGFAIRMHDWGAGALDRLAVAELPALSAEARGFAGGFRVTARCAAAPTFGGVASPALAGDPSAVPPGDVPSVQAAWDYHFAAGAALAPAVELARGRVALEASGRADWLWGVTEPDADPARSPHARFFDRWLDGRLAARVALARGVELTGAVARRIRHSEANDAAYAAAETSWSVGLAWRP